MFKHTVLTNIQRLIQVILFNFIIFKFFKNIFFNLVYPYFIKESQSEKINKKN